MPEVRKIADDIIKVLLIIIAFLCLLLLLLRGKPIALTDHAIMRMKERMGIKSVNKMLRLACRAYRYGKRVEDLPQKAAILMRRKQKEYGNSTMVIYDGFVYVFSKDRALITVYENNNW